MRFRKDWPEKQLRPKVRKLSEEERVKIFSILENKIEISPVLKALNYRIRSSRGRYYYEKIHSDSDVEIVGRVTPLATPKDFLLLEVELDNGKWKTITEGKIGKISSAVSGDKKGTFHGLGVLDKSISLTKHEGLKSVEITRKENMTFFYNDSTKECSAQEVLYHHFGVPIIVIAEPRDWYFYHRTPRIREIDENREKILVDFTSFNRYGDDCGGACLYMKKGEKWFAFTIKPSQSDSIESSISWLEKQKWKDW